MIDLASTHPNLSENGVRIVNELSDRADAALATPPPAPPTIGGVEDAAKAIYSDAMIWAANNALAGITPPWVKGGNSTAQDVARRVARSMIASPPEPPTDDELQQLWRVLMKSTGAILAQPMYDFARAVLERWGK
jgi:hypothetical protein